MRRRVSLLILATLAPCGAPLAAQDPAPAVTAPAVTGAPTGIGGVVLPPGFALHRGFIYRVAAKAELAITARNAKQKLGDGHEVWRMPASAGTATLASITPFLQQQGWTVTPIGGSATDAWLERSGTRVLLIARGDAQEAWAYLAPAPLAAPAAAVAPVASAVDAAPVAAPVATPVAAPAAVTSPPAAPAAMSPSSPRQFRYARSTFDDGWVAEEGTAGVKATRGPLTAWLFVARAVAAAPAGETHGDVLWRTDVVSWFTPKTVARRTRGADGAPIHYYEAEGTINETGQPAFLAMYAAEPGGVGIVRNILLVGPDRATTLASHPTPEAMFQLLQYNKFAVDAADLAGRWVQRGEYRMQLAYVDPALVANEPVAAEITFGADGRYASRGRDGAAEWRSMGTWRVADQWTVVLTDADGHVTPMDAQFELVQGGRVLHLVRRDDRSVQFHLVLAGDR